jgi:hypothetical protein
MIFHFRARICKVFPLLINGSQQLLDLSKKKKGVERREQNEMIGGNGRGGILSKCSVLSCNVIGEIWAIRS